VAIRVALSHRTTYRFDRHVKVSPHEIRLRPAPHCRTPVLGYSLNVAPEDHFLNWQQDPYGNWVARLMFPEPTDRLEVVVDLTADLTVINPFDFFVEPYADAYPFTYAPTLAKELIPFLETEPAGPRLAAWLDAFRPTIAKGENTVDLLVRINQQLQHEIKYLVRMEPGVQTPQLTLERACGSCRDTGWLLVQILRQLGIAARFASGYLIQLVADVKPLDGPAGTERDFTDLHAWAEAYIPGAGWIGLDPTSGLLAGEGHLPLACTADPGSAAPVIGFTDVCKVEFDFAMSVTRVHEDPRVTRPYSDATVAIGSATRSSMNTSVKRASALVFRNARARRTASDHSPSCSRPSSCRSTWSVCMRRTMKISLQTDARTFTGSRCVQTMRAFG
jgi:transglutaminase-like putative cysteine protease